VHDKLMEKVIMTTEISPVHFHFVTSTMQYLLHGPFIS